MEPENTEFVEAESGTVVPGIRGLGVELREILVKGYKIAVG